MHKTYIDLSGKTIRIFEYKDKIEAFFIPYNVVHEWAKTVIVDCISPSIQLTKSSYVRGPYTLISSIKSIFLPDFEEIYKKLIVESSMFKSQPHLEEYIYSYITKE